MAASADSAEQSKQIAAELAYPVAYGVSREQAARLGAWWEERRGIIQPAEFIVDRDGIIIASTYSSGPLGRMNVAEVVRFITSRESAKKTANR